MNPYKYIQKIEADRPEIILSLEWSKVSEIGVLELYRKSKEKQFQDDEGGYQNNKEE